MNHIEQTHHDSINELLEAILSLRDLDECRTFMCDLCTVKELLSLAQRVQVAKRLMAGDTYDTIRSQIPVSSATITRVNTAFQFGNGGYRTVLERLDNAALSDTKE